MEESEKLKLFEALKNRGFYNPHNVFHHAPEIYPEPEGGKYKYKVNIVKWNTSSVGITVLGARWDEKKQCFILSIYKTVSMPRYKHGEKMR